MQKSHPTFNLLLLEGRLHIAIRVLVYETHLMPQFQKSELNWGETLNAQLTRAYSIGFRQNTSLTRRIAVCKRTLSKLSIII
jgi:hypothetical protein